MTVEGNVDWPLKVARWPPARRRARVREVLELLAIADLGRRYPGEISGGQQQRAAIARTIAPQPALLLFDEPLSNLDARLRVEMRAELLRVHRATGATSVYVTHDQIEAVTLATHVAVMRDGQVEQFGAPGEILQSPATAFVATFVGTPPGNLVPVAVHQGRYRFEELDLGVATDGAEGQRRWLLYRPETLSVHPDAGARRLPISLAEASPIAGRTVVTGCFHDQRLSAVVDRWPTARFGDRLYLEFPSVPAAVYGENGRSVG